MNPSSVKINSFQIDVVAFFKNALLFLVSFALVIIFAEFVLRAVYPQRLTHQRENRYTINENMLNWKGQNKTHEYNAVLEFNRLGMRGPEISYKKAEGIRRAMFLGDSFVAGAQVNWNEHMANLVEEEFFAEKLPVQVVNYGVSGWDNVQELIYLKNEGYKFSPDALYLFVYPGNDINGNYGRYYEEGLSQYMDRQDLNLLYRLQEKKNPVLSVKEYLLTHSHLFTLIKLFGESSKLNYRLKGIQRQLHMINIPSRPETVKLSHDEKIEKSWALFQALMTDFSSFCHDKGIRFVVIMVPHVTQVYPDRHEGEYEKVVSRYWGDIQGYERAMAIVRNLKIPVVDLLPAFLKEKADADLYYHEDFHWTPAGHALAAKILAERINPDFAQ